jgi:hypothetical protein
MQEILYLSQASFVIVICVSGYKPFASFVSQIVSSNKSRPTIVKVALYFSTVFYFVILRCF